LEPGSRLAELDWGAMVSGESARRIGCDAEITPVLKNRQGDVLHVGSAARSTPLRMRKALNLRDCHCQWPGCSIPARECESHHQQHWADGGRTTLENVRLLCGYHHRLHHPENHRHREERSAIETNHRGPP
ncbi:MAG: HNH endonuclease signature motif containing protein, partial [Candidatus Dormibacteraceae bacterium]